MWNPMTAQGAWAPEQDQATFYDEIKASPCRGCCHVGDDKNHCRTLPDCPLYIPTLLPPQRIVPDNPKKSSRQKNECQFPGCNKLCAGQYCTGQGGHAQLVYARSRRYPDDPALWFLPVGRKGKRLKKSGGGE